MSKHRDNNRRSPSVQFGRDYPSRIGGLRAAFRRPKHRRQGPACQDPFCRHGLGWDVGCINFTWFIHPSITGTTYDAGE